VQGRLPPVELFHGVPGQVGPVGRKEGGRSPPPGGGYDPGGGGLDGGVPPEQAYLCRRRIIADIRLARSQGKWGTCATWSNVGRILLQVPTQYP
jgi:hypothetical protein